jgi:hypothetical protein
MKKPPTLAQPHTTNEKKNTKTGAILPLNPTATPASHNPLALTPSTIPLLHHREPLSPAETSLLPASTTNTTYNVRCVVWRLHSLVLAHHSILVMMI